MILGICAAPGEYEATVRWVREASRAIGPLSTGGAYVNYLAPEAEEGAGRLRAAYGSAIYERLAALKAKYDPTNFFRMNQNVKPATAGGG